MISQGEKKGPVSSADVQKIQTESVSRHDWLVTMIANNIVVPTVISSSCRFKYKSVKTVKSSNEVLRQRRGKKSTAKLPKEEQLVVCNCHGH